MGGDRRWEGIKVVWRIKVFGGGLLGRYRKRWKGGIVYRGRRMGAKGFG